MAKAALTVRVPRDSPTATTRSDGFDLFQAAPAPQAVVGPTGTLHRVNRAMERILGEAGPRVSGRPLHRFLLRDSRPDWCGHVRAVFASSTEQRVDLALADAEGGVRWIRVVSAPCDDGSGVPRALCTALDVTAERAAAARLRASEAGFRSLVEGSPDAVFLQRDGALVYANAAAARLLDRPLSALSGLSLAEVTLPADLPALAHHWAAATEGAPARQAGRARFRRPDGSEVCAEVHVLRATFDGAPATVTLARDLTERLALQARLARTDRLTSMGTLAAGLAHEINNPLTYMLQNTEMVQEDLADLQSRLAAGAPPEPAELAALLEDCQDCMADVHEGQGRVAALVDDLRGFTRTEGEVGAVDLGAVVGKALKVADQHLRYRARVEVAVGPAPNVLGVEGRLFQVALNLLVNAGQAIPEGAPEDHRVRVSVAAAGDFVRMTLEDTGCGMPQEVIDRAFDPFFTTKEVGEGTGLGLSICRSIVEDGGGRIEVRSRVGEGTRFDVYWPAAGAALPQEAPPRAPRPTARRRVLVVDDESGIRASLARSLGRRHEVTVCGSAAAAADLLADGLAVDLVLCDLLMEDGTGMDLSDWMRTHRPELVACTWFMTGGAFLPQAGAFAATLGPRLLQKPVSLEQLDALLDDPAQAMV